MVKRKADADSSDAEEHTEMRVESSESPERPLQTGRRIGKKAKTQGVSGNESEEEPIMAAKKPKSKSAKTSKAASIKKPKAASPEPEVKGAGDIKVGVNASGEKFVDLGKKRRATVNQFKGGKFLDIREFYGDESDLKPGKKGISLSQDQWEMLKKSSDVIDAFFAGLKK